MASTMDSLPHPNPSSPRKMATSRLKSMITPRNHRHNPSDGTNLSPTKPPLKKENANPNHINNASQHCFLPSDHPHSGQYLRENSRNRDNARAPPQKPIEVYEDDSKSFGLHKRTKSSVSLKSLTGNDKVQGSKSSSPEKQGSKKPKKSKSSTSLSAILTKSKSSKDLPLDGKSGPKDKENRTPPSTANVAPPPIWAQFASQPLESYSTKVPLNDARNNAEEKKLFISPQHSPSKGRNLTDHQAPILPRVESKPRPASTLLPSSPSKTSFAETLSGLRKRGREKSRPEPATDQLPSRSSVESQRLSSDKTTQAQKASNDQHRQHEDIEANTVAVKRGSRVMAAVAAFNGKSQLPSTLTEPIVKPQEPPLDAKAIDTAFESLLDSRNIPPQVRDKMRSLNTKIKADFIKKETSVSGSASSADGLAMHFTNDQLNKRPAYGERSNTDDGARTAQRVEEAEAPRKSRPRSMTFTRSKDSAPAKKERPLSQSRVKSTDTNPSATLETSTDSGSTQAFSFMNRVPRAAKPEDYISYLHKVQKPQLMEIARIQKLRQLLRNETVSWVDEFITKGGMAAMVNLLYRIIDVEWREEHEDTLLHETLLCIKALCTTSLALQELPNIHSTLFPALLGMLFDKEKKGPSEFTTRGIITSLLFTYLSSSPAAEITTRARTLLSYLRDPSKPEEAQPPGFIASIYHPRPYRIWNNEILNVTKEVFWIFLHHANIVPYPDSTEPAGSYATNHFPRERPPVPAAPYIGGVEWDATNYIASHLDLLNGIIASLPTAEERNALRQELKDSGFEKCMGASLRTCKEKFYGSVHAGLTTWIGAAREDAWEVVYVKEGPKRDAVVRTPSPKKGKVEKPPRLEMPKLDLGGKDDEGWL